MGYISRHIFGHTGARIIATRTVAVRIVALAGAAALLSGPADAGLRLGPGAVLGLLAASTHMMAHIGGGAPDTRRLRFPQSGSSRRIRIMSPSMVNEL
jgi:hypothetical protein